jgi:nitrate reductase beta subunit
LGELSLESPINLFVYDVNHGCSDVAEEELKTILQNQGESVLFTIYDARIVLNKNAQGINTSLDDAATNSQAEIIYNPSSLPPPLIPDAPTFFLF